LLAQRLVPLTVLHGRKTIEAWNALARRGDWPALVEQLLTCHYDPAYRRSTGSNFPRLAQARILRTDTLDPAQLHLAAAPLLQPAAK
jgi:tRNA 2-selenouridine synthase